MWKCVICYDLCFRYLVKINGMEGLKSLKAWNDELIGIFAPNIVILSLYLVFGVIGNVLVLFVYGLKMKKQSENRYFIPVLAVSDLLSCIVCVILGFSNSLMQVTFSDATFCVSFSYLSFALIYNTIFILMIIAVHRYIKVCRPFNTQMSLSCKRFSIAVTFCISLMLASPVLTIYGVNDVMYPLANFTGERCGMLRNANSTWSSLHLGAELVVIFGSFIVFVTLYSIIARTVHQHLRFVLKTSSSGGDHSKATRLRQNSGTETIKEISVISENTDQSVNCCVHQSQTYNVSKSKSGEIYAHKGLRFSLRSLNYFRNANRKSSPASNRKNSVGSISNNSPVSMRKSSINSLQTSSPGSNRKSSASSLEVIRENQNVDDKKSKTKKIKTKFNFMFMTITIVYLVCYIPKIVKIFLQMYDPIFMMEMSDTARAWLVILYRIHIIGHVCNPFVYAFTDSKFKKELKQLFSCI